MFALENSKQILKSLRYTMKRRGSKHDPCGMLQITSSILDLQPFTVQNLLCFWKVKKGSYEENILKEALKTSGLATEHHHKSLFSLVSLGTIRVIK